MAIAAGKLRWISTRGDSRTTELPALLTGAPLVLESGTVVALGLDGQAHLVSADGAYLESIPLPASNQKLRFTASVGADRVVAVAAGTRPALILFSLQRGNERSIRLSANLASSPLVADDDTIWTLDERGTLNGIGPDGRTRSSSELGQGGARMHSALGWDGAVRVGLPYGEIACVGARGEERWRRFVNSVPGAMLIDADDTTLVTSVRGTLYAIDRKGELRWRQAIDARGLGRPVLGQNGTLFLVARGGVVQAWR